MRYIISIILSVMFIFILLMIGGIKTTSVINNNIVAERDYKTVHVGQFKNLLNIRSLL
jgi:uncharacterized membrane protein YciS (DUF1049 family)